MKKPKAIFLSNEEIRQLPEYKRLSAYVKEFGAICGENNISSIFIPKNVPGYEYGTRDIIVWPNAGTVRIDPSCHEIFYHGMPLSHLFEIDLSTYKGWDNAILNIGYYFVDHSSESLVMNIIKHRIPADISYFVYDPSNQNLYPPGVNYIDANKCSARYLIGEEAVKKALIAHQIDLIKKDISNIENIPADFDRELILRSAGYDYNEMNAIINSHDVGIL